MKSRLVSSVIGLLLGVAVTLSAPLARADTQSFTHNIPLTDIPFTDTFELPLFESSLGTLTDITIDLVSHVTGVVQIFNASGVSQTFSNASIEVPVGLSGPGLTNANVLATVFIAAGTAAPGLNSYPGTSVNGAEMVLVTPVSFSLFEGPGNGTVFFTTTVGDGIYGGTAGPGVFFSGDAVADGSVTITYSYVSAVPEPATGGLVLIGLALLVAAKRYSRRR